MQEEPGNVPGLCAVHICHLLSWKFGLAKFDLTHSRKLSTVYPKLEFTKKTSIQGLRQYGLQRRKVWYY